MDSSNPLERLVTIIRSNRRTQLIRVQIVSPRRQCLYAGVESPFICRRLSDKIISRRDTESLCGSLSRCCLILVVDVSSQLSLKGFCIYSGLPRHYSRTTGIVVSHSRREFSINNLVNLVKLRSM